MPLAGSIDYQEFMAAFGAADVMNVGAKDAKKDAQPLIPKLRSHHAVLADQRPLERFTFTFPHFPSPESEMSSRRSFSHNSSSRRGYTVIFQGGFVVIPVSLMHGGVPVSLMRGGVPVSVLHQNGGVHHVII